MERLDLHQLYHIKSGKLPLTTPEDPGIILPDMPLFEPINRGNVQLNKYEKNSPSKSSTFNNYFYLTWSLESLRPAPHRCHSSFALSCRDHFAKDADQLYIHLTGTRMLVILVSSVATLVLKNSPFCDVLDANLQAWRYPRSLLSP